MSAKLLKRLAEQSHLPEPVANNLCLEDSIIEAGSIADGDIEQTFNVTAEVGTWADKLSDGICVAESLSDVVDKTIEIYGDAGIDKQGAELLQLSVEMILANSGLGIPASMVAPSFESVSGDYSAEVIDKKNNVISRIFSWLYTAFKALADTIAQFWAKASTSARSVEDYAKKVKIKVDALKGSAKDPNATINLGSSSIWLTNRNDGIDHPDKHIVNTVARFEDFITEWRGHWKSLLEFPVPSVLTTDGSIQDMTGKLKTLAMSSVKGSADVKIDITVGHYIELKSGGGEIPLLNATVKIEEAVSGGNHIAPVLTLDEMKYGIGIALTAMKVLEKMHRDMAGINSITGKISSLSKAISTKEPADVSSADLKLALRGLSKACSIAAWGWTNATPYFLKTIKASVRYIDASANRYS